MSRICSRTLAKNHRHNKKLGQSNDSKHEGIKKRWVINTSERSLTQHEITLLRKGMNFALAPKNVPTKEIIASVEKGIKHLPNDEKNEVRERVCAVVKHAKCPQNKNLSRLEEKALKSLRVNKDILITKADKGNAVVVMNRADYQNQVNEMLEDKNIYTHITFINFTTIHKID
jgi:hypothetical protein